MVSANLSESAEYLRFIPHHSSFRPLIAKFSQETVAISLPIINSRQKAVLDKSEEY